MIDVFTHCRRFFAAAALGAHSNFSPEGGFRQKDFRFLLVLFLNWLEPSTREMDQEIHNTQLSRYLDTLTRHGFALRRMNQKRPLYQITRSGLVELIGQLTEVPVQAPFEQFFFSYYFVRNYSSRLTELVAQKESRLPRSFQIELSAMLDHRELLDQQIKAIQLEIRKLEVRLKETKGAYDLARANQDKGPEEMIRLVELHFPYDLNSTKPMSELMREIPAQLRAYELTEGNLARVQYLWQPQLEHLNGYLRSLMSLKE